jgi:carbonic anhydrase/acetyltransferase-like protein (isoleucine patch superfamily)
MTNNEFMKWFVKGFIAKAKGIPINWVAVTVTTTNKKKSRHKELEKFRSNTRVYSKRSEDAIEVSNVVDGVWRVEG